MKGASDLNRVQVAWKEKAAAAAGTESPSATHSLSQADSQSEQDPGSDSAREAGGQRSRSALWDQESNKCQRFIRLTGHLVTQTRCVIEYVTEI